MFYNTTQLKSDDLAKSRVKAKSQEDLILDFFKSVQKRVGETFPGEFTPDQVNFFVFNSRVPITSVRRAITDLTSEGFLEKTKTKKPGKHGALTYCWRLRR